MTSEGKFTVIESPFSAPTEPELVRNVKYAILAVRHSLALGEVPYASHLFYTQMLDDNDERERMQGMNAGLALCAKADQTAVYTDLGESRGMKYGMEAARKAGRIIVTRTLFDGLNDSEVNSAINDEYKAHKLPSSAALAGIYGRIL